MKKIDLHIHTISTVSDYEFVFSLGTLQAYVRDCKLDAIGITNHNIFDLDQYNKICANIDIQVIPGIEIDEEK